LIGNLRQQMVRFSRFRSRGFSPLIRTSQNNWL